MNNDLINREALKNKFISMISVSRLEFEDIIELIDNAPTVENKQYELLDYIKLSLKDSDEFKEKYRNKYKESNSPHDLYYSHLFEGMAEAYDDILKKMGESESVIGKDTYQIRKAYERGFETGSAVGITEEQAINKLHETGWLPNHDREMTTRPQGEWINGKSDSGDYLKCPKCNFIEWHNLSANFCSNCGAAMVNPISENSDEVTG
jgi:ssDNA-binding Zn-finger/Zn-ribbon topoisomerase 1